MTPRPQFQQPKRHGSGKLQDKMKRAGQPEEVAPCYVFLACEGSAYMAGQVPHPNGGDIVNGYDGCSAVQVLAGRMIANCKLKICN